MHIYREQNQLADELATEAAPINIGRNPPPHILDILHDDRVGKLQQRVFEKSNITGNIGRRFY